MYPTEPAATSPGNAARPHWSVVLRALREARGVTLEGWGARLGVSRKTVQRWESGERAPDPGAEAALLAYCREAGLLRSYDRGPLAGLQLTADLLQDLLAQARWRVRATPPDAALPGHGPAAVEAVRKPETSAQEPPANLPVQLTSFVGREQELAAVRRVQAGTRLLTLAGAGGCGKTRLALALAGELRWAYPHGVWWVDLAPLADPALLPQAVAATLTIRPGGQQPWIDALVEALRERHLLLVLDNCEHLLPGCAERVEILLRAAPHLEVVATSRESLGIVGETVWRVPPLSVPDGPDGIAGSDAARLFIERARLQRPALALTANEEQSVAAICRALEGLPLAIELAAARVNVLSIGQIADRLHDRFRLLTSGGRTALTRHQTLRAAMDWSYELLTPAEQAVLRALSVFAGDFTLEAAEAVCRDERSGTRERETGEPISVPSPWPAARCPLPVSDVLDLLARLVDKSLLIADTLGGAARYRLLETVRQYAAELLTAAGEAREVQERHAVWCLALAEAAWPHRYSAEQGQWLERLTVEHDNLRAALRWCLADDHGGVLGVTLGGLLDWFWDARGHLGEGRQWLAALLARGGEAPPEVRARALEGIGVLAATQGDYDAAVRPLQESLALRREMGDEMGACGLLINLGWVAAACGDPSRARELSEEGLTLARKLGDQKRVGTALNNLGILARQQGDLKRAVACYEESLAVARELGDTRLVAYGLLNLGNAHQEAGAPGRAAPRYCESLSLFRGLKDRRGAALCLRGLVRVGAAGGDAVRAARLAGGAAALDGAIGVQRSDSGRSPFDEAIARVRAVLGEAEFTAAWEAGQALSLEEATTEALSEPTEA